MPSFYSRLSIFFTWAFGQVTQQRLAPHLITADSHSKIPSDPPNVCRHNGYHAVDSGVQTVWRVYLLNKVSGGLYWCLGKYQLR